MLAGAFALCLSTLFACYWPIADPMAYPRWGWSSNPPMSYPLHMVLLHRVVVHTRCRQGGHLHLLKKFNVFGYNDSGMLPAMSKYHVNYTRRKMTF